MYVVFVNNYHIRTMYLVFDNNHHIRSLRKQPFLLALQRWGRCETSSATKSQEKWLFAQATIFAQST